ncbi:hypothetical protein ACXYMX_14855 [Sporosarcina sp. CAU 1771]
MNFQSFSGTVTSISDFWVTPSDENGGCYKLFEVNNGVDSIVNFVVGPNTYFVDHEMIFVGDPVIGFYDADVPVPMIYPPQYQAVVMAISSPMQNVKVDYFNNQLLSSDGSLRLNISAETQIVLENGQSFNRNPANRYLTVVYGATTRSIPAQTTPSQIIVMC